MALRYNIKAVDCTNLIHCMGDETDWLPVTSAPKAFCVQGVATPWAGRSTGAWRQDNAVEMQPRLHGSKHNICTIES